MWIIFLQIYFVVMQQWKYRIILLPNWIGVEKKLRHAFLHQLSSPTFLLICHLESWNQETRHEWPDNEQYESITEELEDPTSSFLRYTLPVFLIHFIFLILYQIFARLPLERSKKSLQMLIVGFERYQHHNDWAEGRETASEERAQWFSRPLQRFVYARHGHELIGCKSRIAELLLKFLP